MLVETGDMNTINNLLDGLGSDTIQMAKEPWSLKCHKDEIQPTTKELADSFDTRIECYATH